MNIIKAIKSADSFKTAINIAIDTLNACPIQNNKTYTVEINIDDEKYFVHIGRDVINIISECNKADISIYTSQNTFFDLICNKISPQRALILSKVKIKGNLSLLNDLKILITKNLVC